MHWRLGQRGLSLIELMISMLIGSVIILGVLNLFTANLQTYNVLQAQSRLQEGAHYGLNVMNRDVRKTGYRGCYSSGDLYAAVTTIAGQFDIRTAFFGVQWRRHGLEQFEHRIALSHKRDGAGWHGYFGPALYWE